MLLRLISHNLDNFCQRRPQGLSFTERLKQPGMRRNQMITFIDEILIFLNEAFEHV